MGQIILGCASFGVGVILTATLFGLVLEETEQELKSFQETAIEQKVGYYCRVTGDFQLIIVPEEQLKQFINDNPFKNTDKEK